MSGSVNRSRQAGSEDRTRKQIEVLLAAGLETWAHQFLYFRRVYPKATFGNVRFLGIQCYVNRHPDVVKYIHETVSLAASAILQGYVDEMSLMITCFDHSSQECLEETVEECRTLEECQIRFGNFRYDGFEHIPDNNSREELETCFREMILRLGSLEGMSLPFVNEIGLSFRLELGMAKNTTEKSIPQSLHSALSEGRCVESSNDWKAEGGSSRGIVVRPLCQSNLPFGKVNLFHRRIKQVHATDGT